MGIQRFLRSRNLLFIVIFVFIGFAFGSAMTQLPSPTDPKVFWIANLASPWLLLAFTAGLCQQSSFWASLTGVLTVEAAMIGFYGPQFLTSGNDSANAGWSLSSLYATWFSLGLTAGLVYGFIGYVWRRTNMRSMGFLVGLPFLLEPWAWSYQRGYVPEPIWLWAIESIIGILLITYVFMTQYSKRQTARKSFIHQQTQS